MNEREVRDVMTSPVLTARPKDRLEKALKPVIEKKVGALPVLDKDQRLIGIVTRQDLLKAFQAALGSVGTHLRTR